MDHLEGGSVTSPAHENFLKTARMGEKGTAAAVTPRRGRAATGRRGELEALQCCGDPAAPVPSAVLRHGVKGLWRAPVSVGSLRIALYELAVSGSR